MLKDLVEVLRKCDVDMKRMKKLNGDSRDLDEGIVQAVRENHFQKEISIYLYILSYALADILCRVAHGLLVSDILKG